MTFAGSNANPQHTRVVGVAPMAGRGSRLGLTISKELAPLSQSRDLGTTLDRKPVLSEIMLQRMLEAGIRDAVLTISRTKQDIRQHFGSCYRSAAKGKVAEMALSYVTADQSPNTPTSIDAAYDLVRNKVCALGFADILYSACPGYGRALARLERSGADVVLGLFPTGQPASSDMVAFDAGGRVLDIHIKKALGKRFAYTWSLAVWQPSFTQFLHNWVAKDSELNYAGNDGYNESYIGDVVLAAMRSGMRVEALPVSARASLDAGTPETLAKAQQRFGSFSSDLPV